MGALEIAFVAAASFATVVGSAVVFTVLMFPKMRERVFMKIIANVVICDIIGSASAALGFPKGDTNICMAQSFLVAFFYKAGWLWTVALAYQLYCVVINHKFGLSMFHMHLLCWSCTIITTLLPLTTNRLGRDDDQEIGWCFLTGDETTAAFWGLITFNAVLLVCALAISYFLFRIYWRYRSMNIKSTYPEVYTIIDLLILYPPGFLITWGPNLIMSVIFNFHGAQATNTNITIFNAISILATQSGTLVTIIFFLKSKEARYRWAKLFSNAFKGTRSSSSMGGVRVSDQSDQPCDFHDEETYERRIAAELGGGSPQQQQQQIKQHNPAPLPSNHVRFPSERGSMAAVQVSPSAQNNSLFSMSPRLHSNHTVMSDEEGQEGFRTNPMMSAEIGEEENWKYSFRTPSEYGSEL